MKFYCRPKAKQKRHFGKSHFYCRRFFPGNTVTIILDNYPPSTLQGVGLGCRKNSENYCRRKLLSFRRPLNRDLVETNFEASKSKALFSRHCRASDIALTKAGLPKYDLHFHGYWVVLFCLKCIDEGGASSWCRGGAKGTLWPRCL